MTLPVNKATTPFKTMDIKTALLSGGNRKRKSTSQASKDEPKSKKISAESSDHENDLEVLDEACGITVVLQPSENDSTLGDCKENKDINATKLEYPLENTKDRLLNSSKEEKLTNSDKKSCDMLTLNSPKTVKIVSDNDIELLSDKSKKSDDSSCDEQFNNSANVSLNTSELSVTGEDNDKEHNAESKVKVESQNKNGMAQTDTKEKVKKKRMTPAEAQKRAEEREKQQKERLLKKQELESKKKERQLEKEQKLKEKMVKKEREEIERKERERIKQEKKEQEEKERLKRQQEKEEKAKLKQMQLEQKLEEKKKKEEMRLKKEEELKKAEEEKQRAKLEKEQKEKEKQERAKAAFAKFFLKGGNNNSTPAQTSEKGAFLPFQVSDDMTLAPVVPPAAQERFDKKQLDHYLKLQDSKKLYLDILKSGVYKDVRHRKKNKKLEESDVIIIDTNAQAELGLHPKLLQFHENVRPPYWGTWRKKSKNIGPRNPFGQDEMFDYDIDSDDEWDEGGPGESLSGTENEVESEDDYEVDNEFFVPHGYLSDEEEKKEDDDEEVNDPEKQKARLKLKLQEFEMERKKKTTELKPVIVGCYFANDPAFQDSALQMFLQAYNAEFLTETPIPTSFTIKSQQNGSSNNTSESPKSANSNYVKKKNFQPVPEKAFPQLIRLVHGNIKNRRILAEEFQKFWLEHSGEKPDAQTESVESPSTSAVAQSKDGVNDVPSDYPLISLRKLTQTIREIASYGKPPDLTILQTFNKCCWWVHDSIREKYGLLDAPIPNQWKYVSQKEPEPLSKNNSASIKGFLSSN